jgi:PAS domain S-box-containing protein
MELVRVRVAFIIPEGIIGWCNPAYATILGMTPEVLTGRSFFEFLNAAQKKKAHREREVRLEDVPSEYEIAITAADGSEKRLLATGAPLYGEDGTYLGAVQTLTDVTEQKRSNEALKRSEERFRLVARATGEVVWDNDLLADAQEWDGAVEEAFGYSKERVEGTKAWWEGRVHPEDRGRVLAGLDVVLRPGGREVWEEEYRFLKADGSYAHVEDRGYVVRDARTQEAVRMVGSMADVTWRRRVEREIHRSEARYRFAFKEAPVPMAHVAPDGRWLKVNKKMCELSGYSCEELQALSLRELIHPEELEASLESIRQVFASARASYQFVGRRYLKKDGTRVWLDLKVSVAGGREGEPRYLVCVAEDVTARKLKELVPDPLTDRELDVLRLVCDGLTNPQIARRLSHSPGTVKLEVQHIIAKLGVGNRRDAVVRAVEIGLVPPPR